MCIDVKIVISRPPPWRSVRAGAVVCLLCRGMISFKAGDSARFRSHLQHEHEAYFGLDVLLALSFVREDER